MTLKDMLNYFDWLQKIVIWDVDENQEPDEEEEPIFEGYVMDTPYHILDCQMVTQKELEQEYDIDSGIRSWEDAIYLYIHG